MFSCVDRLFSRRISGNFRTVGRNLGYADLYFCSVSTFRILHNQLSDNNFILYRRTQNRVEQCENSRSSVASNDRNSDRMLCESLDYESISWYDFMIISGVYEKVIKEKLVFDY